MLSLYETPDEVSVVADQRGNPTSALDLAAALLAIAARVREGASPVLLGVFHMTRSGEATWANFAEAIFVEAAARGRHLTRVKRTTTTDYPTPAPPFVANDLFDAIAGASLPSDTRPKRPVLRSPLKFILSFAMGFGGNA